MSVTIEGTTPGIEVDGSGAVVNVTVTTGGGGGGGVTDHGALSGLADDDHTQYALADGTRGAFAATVHVHDGSDITTGTVAPARLGTGTPDAFTFLDGTGAWVADVPVFLAIKNTTANTIVKGAALVATGSVGASGAVEVGLADADDPTKMPAIGLAATAIPAGGSGHAVVTGVLRGLDTNAYSVNAPVYISTVAGQLTPTRPTGASELVQNIGRVVRVHGSTGEIIVLGPGRSNDIPNSIDGAAITTGTVAAARLGSGTPSSANFLRGDGSWAAVGGWDILSTTTLGSAASSIALSEPTAGAWANYREFRLRARNLRANTSGTTDRVVTIQFNGDTASNYWSLRQAITSNGSSSISVANSGTDGAASGEVGLAPELGSASATLERNAQFEALIMNPAVSDGLYRTCTSTFGHWRSTATASSRVGTCWTGWASTALITSITLTLSAGNFAPGSTVTLEAR